MKILLSLCLAICFVLSDHDKHNSANIKTNPVIGDEAYVETFGTLPDESISISLPAKKALKALNILVFM